MKRTYQHIFKSGFTPKGIRNKTLKRLLMVNYHFTYSPSSGVNKSDLMENPRTVRYYTSSTMGYCMAQLCPWDV